LDTRYNVGPSLKFQTEKLFNPKENVTIAVHVVSANIPSFTPTDVLNTIHEIYEIEGETISFDSQLDVVKYAGITRTMTGIEERYRQQHIWENFWESSGFHYSNATAKYPNKVNNKTIWNHVFAVFYNTDNWLSFEEASKEVNSLRNLDFGLSYTRIPVPPVVLIGLNHKGTTPVVKESDAEVLASKYGIANVVTTIENKKFVNPDVYTALLAARAPTDGSEKA